MINELLELIEINIKGVSAYINGGPNDLFWEGKIAGLTLMREEIHRLTKSAEQKIRTDQAVSEPVRWQITYTIG